MEGKHCGARTVMWYVEFFFNGVFFFFFNECLRLGESDYVVIDCSFSGFFLFFLVFCVFFF